MPGSADVRSALFGLIARDERARHLLLRDPEQLLPRTSGRGERWWIDPRGRVAMRGARAITMRNGDLAIAATGEAHTISQLVKLAPRLAAGNWSDLAGVRGAFALAVWNGRFDMLTLARDRIGQHTLHAREDRDVLWFSSDPDALLRARRSSFDLASAAAYLTRGHALLGRTLAAEVRAVPAAHCVHYQHDHATLARYWTPLRPVPRLRKRTRIAELRDRLDAAVSEASVRRQGVLLSGGVDSSLIACLAARNTGPPVAFTLTTGENGEDVRYASIVARAIAARHIVVELDAAGATRVLPRILDAGIPMSAWTAISHVQLLAAIAREGLSHALSGMGADELFGGYDRFVEYFYRQRRYARLWGVASDWFDGLIHDPVRATADLFPGIATFFDAVAREGLLSVAAQRISPPGDVGFYEECRRIAPEAGVLAMMGAHEAQHRIPDLLLQTFEPLARAAGIELAYPFLDRDVAHLAMTLAADDHFWFEAGAWWAKRTLRGAARGVVPASIVMRRRIAYDVPIAAWLRDRKFGTAVVDRLAATKLWGAGLLRRTARTHALRDARAVTRGELERPGPACDRTWALLTLGAWYDRYVERG